ncbi:hypothetical protein P879_05566 [Paragonimus westermani]|uniref:Uncharacterized protein n=1 Tax=Paragonimus westermani TaxID=34504 RepID=A0A8T0D0T7_9TREM|nr:hypothetical protein P879_05566 [Paragonimus westermani]
MATGMGSPTKTDDFEPFAIPFKVSYRVSCADCHRPSTEPLPSFDSDADLPLWRWKVGLNFANIPNDHQGPYALSLLSDSVLEVLWSCDLRQSQLRQFGEFDRRDDNRKLGTADGTVLRWLGMTRPPGFIDGFSVFHDFFVSEEIPWEAIIEGDSLKRFNCTVDFNRQLFKCGSCELHFAVETQNETDRDIGLIELLPEDLNYQMDNNVNASKHAITVSSHYQIHSMISKHKAAFAWEGTTLGRTKVLDHQIPTWSTLPNV